MLFQPFFGVGVLAEEETTGSETVAENNQASQDSSNQAAATNDQTTSVNNENNAAVENNLTVTAQSGENTVAPEPVVEIPSQEITPTPTPPTDIQSISSEPTLTPTPTSTTDQPTPTPTPTIEEQIIPTPTPEVVENQSPSASQTAAENVDTGSGSENIASASAEQTTIVTNENQAEVENTATISAQTGENLASSAASLIETGEATVEADLVNIVNTNLVGENFWQAIVNLFGTSENDIDLTQIEGYQNFDPTLISVLARNENTGDGSVNIALASLFSSFAVYNTNSATLTNNINLLASTGNNQISGNESQTQTGDATAILNLFNLVNTNLVGRDWFFGVINLFGELQGDIILPYELQFLGEEGDGDSQVLAQNQNTGEGSQNQAQASGENTVEITNTNDATLTNNISVLANSGENAIIGGGTIQTGEAQASANLVNIVNTNIVGSRWLLLVINNFGRWTGSLVGWWGNLISLNDTTLAWIRLPNESFQPTTIASENENTGENSENQASASAATSLVVENTNTALVENDISVVTSTGGNQIEGESASIQTGKAQASANVFNFINTNITGNNWFFGIINVFDNFFGDIIFPRPDLVISKTADRETVLPGEEITYTINYQNQGRLWAKNTVITDTLPGGTIFVSASSGGVYQNGQVVWNLGKVWPGQGGSLTLRVKVNSDVNLGTELINLVKISTATNEPRQENNTAFVKVLVSSALPSPFPSPTPTVTPSALPPSPTVAPEGVGGPPGPPAAPVCSDTPPGGAPTLLSAVAGVNSVTLTWSKAANPVSYYLVAYGLSSGNYIYGNPNVGGPETTSYSVGNLSGGVTYYFIVRAGNGCAPGPFSNELVATPYGGPSIGVSVGFFPGVLGVKAAEGEIDEALATEAAEFGEVAGIEERPKPIWPWWLILVAAGSTLLYIYFKRK